jgi:hypothetical protein
VEFTPGADYCGTGVSFDYVLNGGSSATVTFDISCVNDAPVTVGTLPDVASGPATMLAIDTAASFSDVDDPSLDYAISSVPTLPAGITIDSGSGQISGVPGAGTEGDYVITVTASDAEPLSAQQVFTLTILPADVFADGFEE